MYQKGQLVHADLNQFNILVSFISYTHTHTHTHTHTITLSHYHTLSHTITLSHYHTITHYHTIFLSFSDISKECFILLSFFLKVWHGLAWIIDVAQAVDHNHPNSLYFLRRDCYNITKFFNHKSSSHSFSSPHSKSFHHSD
jgi:serine/threonine-protein kinase RIO1